MLRPGAAGVFIFSRNSVQPPIIDTRLEKNKKEPSTHWRRGTYQTRCQRLTEVLLHGLLLRSRKIVQSAGTQRGAREQVNRTVVRAVKKESKGMILEDPSDAVVDLWDWRGLASQAGCPSAPAARRSGGSGSDSQCSSLSENHVRLGKG